MTSFPWFCIAPNPVILNELAFGSVNKNVIVQQAQIRSAISGFVTFKM